MNVKYQLGGIDLAVIERAKGIVTKDYKIDPDGFIKIDTLLCIIDDLIDRYGEAWDKLQEYDTRCQETWHDHFINEQIDKGMHPSEYE